MTIAETKVSIENIMPSCISVRPFFIASWGKLGAKAEIVVKFEP
jgi:hypothetical protein